MFSQSLIINCGLCVFLLLLYCFFSTIIVLCFSTIIVLCFSMSLMMLINILLSDIIIQFGFISYKPPDGSTQSIFFHMNSMAG